MITSVAILLSIIGQLIMTIMFAKEALTTQEGTYCRVKCTIAGLIYLSFAGMLAWFFFINPVEM